MIAIESAEPIDETNAFFCVRLIWVWKRSASMVHVQIVMNQSER